MKVYIFVDMEGISGVAGSDWVRTDGRYYQAARRYYTWDINACVAGCFDAGADSVLVRDGHSSSNHAIWEELDPRIEIVQGSGAPRRMPGLDECGALILLGYHAMAGAAEALLEHTYSSASVQNMWLNGRLAGEFAIDAAIAGDAGIPTVMVSGDDKVCAEALSWVPDIVTCQVKQGLACQSARLLAKDAAHALIRARALDAVRAADRIAPLRVEHPVTIRKQFVERHPIPVGYAARDITIIDARTYDTTGDTVEEAFSAQ